MEKLEESEYIGKVKQMECWYNISIKTATKVPHNKANLIIWNHEKVVCTVINFNKVAEKKSNNKPLIRNLQIMHPSYKFNMILFIAGCPGYVQNDLT